MSKQEKLEAVDEVLSHARQAWLDAPVESKKARMDKIDELLERRIKIMNEPNPTPQ